jgi:hypothetical protein
LRDPSSKSTRRRRAAALGLACAATLALPLAASAAERGYERVTPPADDPYLAVVDEIIDDGRLFWRAAGNPPGVDPDGGSAITNWDALTSFRGPNGWSHVPLTQSLVDLQGAGSGGIRTIRASKDGTKVLVYAPFESMVPEDTDGVGDSYILSADGTPPIQVAGPNSTGHLDRRENAASEDLSVVAFLTAQQLAPTDTDTRLDLYARDAVGAIHHVSVDSNEFDPGVGAIQPHTTPGFGDDVGVVSPDGQRIFFSTPDSLDPGDVGGQDVYMRVGFEDTVRLTSASGSATSTKLVGTTDKYVFLRTAGSLVPEDEDGTPNLYRIDVETREAVWIKTGEGMAALDLALSAMAPDGEHVVFPSLGVLDPNDTDERLSLYRWDQGVYRYLGPIHEADTLGPGQFAAQRWQPSVRISDDGRVVAWSTRERVTADDADDSEDVYVDADGVTTRISQGPGTGNSGISAQVAGTEFLNGDLGQFVTGRGMTADGSTVYLTTAERLLVQDINAADDVYAWSSAGGLELISPGKKSHDAVYVGNTPDGLDVFFRTTESFDGLMGAVPDIWDARVGGGFPLPPVPPESCAGDDCAAPPSLAAPFTRPGSTLGSGDERPTAARPRISVAGLSRAARDRLARTGMARLRVRVSSPGRVRLIARARVGGKATVVGRASRVALKAGSLSIPLRLSRAARSELRRGGRLRLVVDVRHSKVAAGQKLTLRLSKDGGRA